MTETVLFNQADSSNYFTAEMALEPFSTYILDQLVTKSNISKKKFAAFILLGKKLSRSRNTDSRFPRPLHVFKANEKIFWFANRGTAEKRLMLIPSHLRGREQTRWGEHAALIS